LDASLIQLITDLVMAEMNRGEGAKPPPVSEAAPKGRRLLLVPAATSTQAVDPLWSGLKELPGVSWTAVRVPGVCERRLDWVRWIDPPAIWDELVHSMEAVVLPVFRLEVISRVALLLGDVPASAAALAGVMQGVPVLASAHEVDLVKRASGRLPGPFLSLFHQHLRSLEGMGIQVLEAEALVNRLAQRVSTPAAAVAKGRDVITLEDLEAAVRAGQKVLSVTPGAIITPLAREKAAQLGIEVVYS